MRTVRVNTRTALTRMYKHTRKQTCCTCRAIPMVSTFMPSLAHTLTHILTRTYTEKASLSFLQGHADVLPSLLVDCRIVNKRVALECTVRKHTGTQTCTSTCTHQVRPILSKRIHTGWSASVSISMYINTRLFVCDSTVRVLAPGIVLPNVDFQ